MIAYHVAPAGYTRTHLEFRKVGCARHGYGNYQPLCPDCHYEERHIPHTLGAIDEDGNRIIALILDPDDGSVLDYLTATTWRETAATLAASGVLVIVADAPDTAPSIRAAIHEAELRADCFGRTLPALPASEEPSLVVA